MIDDSNDETNFRLKLLSTDTVLRFHKAFANDVSPNIKFSKIQASKIVQLEGFSPFFTFILCVSSS